MSAAFVILIVFLLALAVVDLFVGVSNDAVNFLAPAVGARAGKFRTVMAVACLGVLLGALMSSGMMDVARHGILQPVHYSFSEVMFVFLAVMASDVLILDVFNSLGMPTSTTVSLVFELLGAAFVFGIVKLKTLGLPLAETLNTDKALSVIIAIFLSVAIAFFAGLVVMWLVRLAFTFSYRGKRPVATAIFCGISFAALGYFILIKGIGSQLSTVNYQLSIVIALFVLGAVLAVVLQKVGGNMLRVVVLLGTFALAMAFASNDLVNFIGVPLAALDAVLDFNAHGSDPATYMMQSLMESAKSPMLYLFIAGVVMIVAMCTSRKAQAVVQTSVDLARQSEGNEAFSSSRAARRLVRSVRTLAESVESVVPKSLKRRIATRFSKAEMVNSNGAAFDELRAAVNLVLSALLIIFGTMSQLPLSTTYVTFMVAMGSGLADGAWTRDSAVFRITGVISVIGGWFLTAGAAFTVAGAFALLLIWGGMPAAYALVALVCLLLYHSNKRYRSHVEEEEENDRFQLMLASSDKDFVFQTLREHITASHAELLQTAAEAYAHILDGLSRDNPAPLRACRRELKQEKEQFKRLRRQQIVGLKRIEPALAAERSTWFHLAANSGLQIVYCLLRMLEPTKEHVDNTFRRVPQEFLDEFAPVRAETLRLLADYRDCLLTADALRYRPLLAEAEALKARLSEMRRDFGLRLQGVDLPGSLGTALIYLNILQETQEMLSAMRHELRGCKKFILG